AGAADGRLDRARVAQVGLHRMDLADPPERLQMAGQVGPAHRDADAIAVLGEYAHHMAAEEARAAEDGDLRVGGDGGHAALACVEQMGRGRMARERTRRTVAAYRIGFALYR